MAWKFKKRAGKVRCPGALPMVEALETRTHFDLAATSITTSPALFDLVVASVPNTGRSGIVTVAVTNNGPAIAVPRGFFNLTLFASSDLVPDTTPDATTIQITPTPVKESLPRLAAGATRIFRLGVRLNFPAGVDLPAGSYHILAQLSGGVAGATSFGTSTQVVPSVAPFVDLTDQIALLSPKLGALHPGDILVIEPQIFNIGNIFARGSLDINVAFSPNADGSSPIVPGSRTRTIAINLRPNTDLIAPIGILVPGNMPPGKYFAVVTIDVANTLGETTLANNKAVSLETITVA